MFAHEERQKSTGKSKLISAVKPKQNAQCIQLYAPLGLTAGFSLKHMFRPLAANSLTYSDGTIIENSTLVKLPDGARDLKDLYEAATPGVNVPGNVDFEVPTVQYSGAALTADATPVNRFLQFTTNTSGQICHLENAVASQPGHSYASLRPRLPEIRATRRAAVEQASKAGLKQADDHVSLIIVNGWISKITGQMDLVTLAGHKKEAEKLNNILEIIINLNQYLKNFPAEVLNHVNGSFFDQEIRNNLKPTGSMGETIQKYLKALVALKDSICKEMEEWPIATTDDDGEEDDDEKDYKYVLISIEELNLQQTALNQLVDYLKKQCIDDLKKWLEEEITDKQLSYIEAGYSYSDIYC